MISLNIHATLDTAALTTISGEAFALVPEITKHPMGGWFDLPDNFSRDEFTRIKHTAAAIQETSQYLVCIGIGGSYLGHRALIEALGQHGPTKVLYAGHNLSARALDAVFSEIGDADFSVNVISKSGTTLEPALAFNFFKEKLVEKYGETAAFRRIYATTDGARGTLHDEAVEHEYTRFVVPDNIGGRYSVLSPVGLLPLAVAGLNLDALLSGAGMERYHFLRLCEQAPEVQYASVRHLLRSQYFDVEVLATFEPELYHFTEWWKQLFGESEGKDGQGIFPAATVYSTDLHSLGQYLQQGRPNLFETVLSFPQRSDHLLDKMNRIALDATVTAHAQARPVITLGLEALDEKSLGALIWFFETSCALSAMLQGSDPFNQPGVETYKAEMKRLMANQ